MQRIAVGDLVRVIADNADLGLGLIVGSENDREGAAYRVLTSDGRCLYYFPWELMRPFPDEPMHPRSQSYDQAR